ncbi:MAG: hypothetical protein HC930_07685 [Hydrococcus sp. SU_1_0]|nr:hypothetical protein [Hydrococcus sp. SU_1_0]
MGAILGGIIEMLERILLAAIITFCVYLFLNLGSKSSNNLEIDAKQEVTSGFWGGIASISF